MARCWWGVGGGGARRSVGERNGPIDRLKLLDADACQMGGHRSVAVSVAHLPVDVPDALLHPLAALVEEPSVEQAIVAVFQLGGLDGQAFPNGHHGTPSESCSTSTA